MNRIHSAAIALALVASALAIESCLAPTEIQLTIFTNLDCNADAWQGVAVYAGAADDGFEGKQATFVSRRDCQGDGVVGSVYVVPSGSKKDEVALRVVTSLTGRPDDCADAGYRDCIVARRELRFDPHTAVSVSVDLDLDCANIPCDAHTSCYRGQCKDSHLLDAGAHEPVDGGATDATSDDAIPDTGNADAIPEETVQCGSTGLRCPLHGNECCLTIDIDAQTTTGQCIPGSACSAAHFGCDDESDCTDYADDAGHPGMCLLLYDHGSLDHVPREVHGSACVGFEGYLRDPFDQFAFDLCQHRQSCYNGQYTCAPIQVPADAGSALPGYNACTLNAVH